MRTKRWRKTSRRRSSESGQALLFILLAMGIFLVGAVGFAVDFGNMWFHKQSAQTAADAACTAGAMDLLVDATNGVTTQGGFTAGTAFDCSAHPTYAPCQYAALNGYNGTNTTPGNQVYVSFLNAASAPPGVTPPPAALLPAGVPPFMRVDVLDRVQTFFSGLLSRRGTVNVRAFAVCGLVNATSPIPIIILNPKAPGTLSISGTPTVAIVGGANRSIQVNSSSATAVTVTGSWGVNLECGGTAFTGSAVGVWGGPSSQTYTAGSCPGTPIPNTFPPKGGGFYPGSTGSWGPGSPVADPFAQLPAPARPLNDCTIPPSSGGKCFPKDVGPGVNGCPVTTGFCTEFSGGYYPGNNTGAICLGNSCKSTFPGYSPQNTAIFDPGVYYLNGGLALQDQSLVRPSTAAGDGSHGTVFFLTSDTTHPAPKCSGQVGLVCVGSNSGNGGAMTAFSTSLAQCPGGPPIDPNLGVPATLSGNVFLAPCTGTYGDPLGKYRGILFFQDRSLNIGGGWGGGGGYLLAGSMYFHSCNASGTGTGCSATVCTTIGSCAAGSSFGSQMTMQGGSGSTSYVLGEIITDALAMAGNPKINMSLNPNAAYNVLKVSLLQ